MRHGVIIIGGGIVGMATAHAVLMQQPGAKVVVLEKEARLCAHQTGRNSGVIHSGIYYKPGSFKARLCTSGREAMYAFCVQHGIAHERCGKVIVATEAAELPQLEKLRLRGVENGLEVHALNAEQLREHEPHMAGIAGLWVKSTGIVNYKAVVAQLADLVKQKGGEVRLGAHARRVSAGRVETQDAVFETQQIINCAGLHSDRMARMAGTDPGAQIVPFRGEYYQLSPEKVHLVKGLIYPVPDPQFPFLGVHCTKMIDGSVHLGPNAVLAFAREGYFKTTLNPRDLAETLTFGGFWKLAARHWRSGFQEILRSLSRAEFVRSLQRLVPEITEADVIPCAAGVRAQALLDDGSLVDDFLIRQEAGIIHVLNAPSPAATASLEIGRHIASLLKNV
ncbi:MAG: L-2-hydroxyglutarate oxidase [Verrucomicrobiota bacterium]